MKSVVVLALAATFASVLFVAPPAAVAADGQALQIAPLTVDFADVAFPTASHGWTVAGRWGSRQTSDIKAGAIYATADGGRSWAAQASKVTTDLYGVDFIDERTGWAVGASDRVLRTIDGGATWTSGTTGTGGVLHDVDFVDATHGWAVGFSLLGGQIIAATTDGGTTWTRQVAPDGFGLKGVSFIDRRQGFAVGPAGVGYRTDDGGLTWVRMVLTGDGVFNAVRRLSRDVGVAATELGLIVRTTDGGLTWKEASDRRKSVFGLDALGGTVVAVGANGTAAVSTDAGAEWTAQATGLLSDLRGVALRAPGTAVAAGVAGRVSLLDFSDAVAPAVPLDLSGRNDTCTGVRIDWARNAEGLPLAVTAGDLDGDGSTTVVTAAVGGVAAIRPFIAQPDDLRWKLAFPARVRDVTLAQLDGDTGLEVVAGTAVTNTARNGVVALDGATGQVKWSARVRGGGTQLAVADLTSDGIDDIAVVGDDHALYMLDGRNGAHLRPALALGAKTSDVEAGHLNGDTTRDLVISLEDGRVVAVDGRSGATLWTFTSGGGEYHAVAVADVTGDGHADVVAGGYGPRASVADGGADDSITVGSTTGGLITVLNRGGARIWDYGEAGAIRYTALAVGDLNRDGIRDVAAHGYSLDAGHIVALDGRGRRVDGAATGEAAPLWSSRTTVERADLGGQRAMHPEALTIGDGGVYVALEHGAVIGVSGAGPFSTSLMGVPRAEPAWTASRGEGPARAAMFVAIGSQKLVLTVVEDGHLALRDAATGAVRWSHDTGARASIAAADVDRDGRDEVVRTSAAGRVSAIGAGGAAFSASDALLPNAGSAVTTVDVDGDGRKEVVGASVDGTVQASDARTGEIRWTATVGHGFVRSLAAGGGIVSVATAMGRLVGLDATTGSERWTAIISATGGANAVADAPQRGAFIAAGGDGNVVAVTRTGAILWQTDVGGPMTSLAVAEFDGKPGDDLVAGGSGGLHALDANGQSLWGLAVTPGVTSVAVGDLDGDDGNDVVTVGPGKALGIDGRSGAKRWETSVNESGALAVFDIDGDGDDEALVASNQGVLFGRLLVVAGNGSIVASCTLATEAISAVAADEDADGFTEPVVATIGGDLFRLVPDPARTVPDKTPPPGDAATVLAFAETSARAGQYTDRAAVSARLSDATGQPVAGAEVTFELTGADVTRLYRALTDSQGIAARSLDLVDAPGDYTLTARYPGEAGRYKPATIAVAFRIDREDTTMTLTVQSVPGGRDLVAVLTDADSGLAVTNRPVTFLADGRSIGTANTDASGVARLSVPKAYRNGSHTFEARFSGDLFWAPAAAVRTT